MGLRLLGSILEAKGAQAEKADLSTALPRHVVSLVINPVEASQKKGEFGICTCMLSLLLLLPGFLQTCNTRLGVPM